MARRSAIRQMVAGWCVGCLLALSAPALADTYPARDTLGVLQDDQPAAAQLIERIQWQAEAFEVTVAPAARPGDGDAVVRFASARPGEDPRQNTVPLLWFQARDEAGQPLEAPAPAVLVIHTIHPQLLIGKTVARAFARQGLHAFVLQMPGFGDRAAPGRPGVVTLFEHADQAVADARRARDAIAALPQIAEGPVALQATSLGGFIASVAASLDNAFNPVMLALTGGDSLDVLENGRMDAATARNHLARHGYTGDALRSRLALIEPLNVAHRLDPARTWLFTGRRDQVIPAANADALADAIGVDDAHHQRFDADHYSAVLHLPTIIRRMTDIVRDTER